MRTTFIDEIVEKFIVQRGTRPAFKGYRGFRLRYVFLSIDRWYMVFREKEVIQDGDLVSVDIGVEYQDIIPCCF